MKENLNVQIVYPDYEIPDEYKVLIDTVDHADIVSSNCADLGLRENAEVITFNTLNEMRGYPLKSGSAYVLKIDIDSFIENVDSFKSILPKVDRLNVVFINPENFSDDKQQLYSKALDKLAESVVEEYKNSRSTQINLLTDRIMLNDMNNCNAGTESITIAPDGKFYICPAFYLNGEKAVGDLSSNLEIPNPQLYRIDHAPICRICDAYQCRRCVWLNKKLTLEVNTPSRQQCVMSHVERNASRGLLSKIRKIGTFLPEKEISEINYLDPFDNLEK